MIDNNSEEDVKGIGLTFKANQEKVEDFDDCLLFPYSYSVLSPTTNTQNSGCNNAKTKPLFASPTFSPYTSPSSSTHTSSQPIDKKLGHRCRIEMWDKSRRCEMVTSDRTTNEVDANDSEMESRNVIVNNIIVKHNKNMITNKKLRVQRMALFTIPVLIFTLLISLSSAENLSSVTFPYASAASFPNSPSTLSFPSSSSSSSSASSSLLPSTYASASSLLSSPSSSSPTSGPTVSSPSTEIVNRSTKLTELLQTSASRPTPNINHLQFCGAPPSIPNAQSNLMRNQKHHVFPVGITSIYDCVPGFRPSTESLHIPTINATRCTFAPSLPANSASNVIFPDSSLHESLRSGRAKNSKRLLDIEDEPDANNDSSQNRVNSVQFSERHKSGRSEDFTYDTGNESFLSGRHSDLESDPEILEHKKQKIENTVRSGQRSDWYPAVTLKCERVTCNDPGQVEHANRTLSSSEGFVFNSNVYYGCHPGYKPIGVPILSCRQDGTWNRPPPKCVLQQCPILPPIDNGRILYNNDRKVDSQAEYHCDAGYRLNAPTHVRRCQEDSSWTKSVPILLDIPNPSRPEINDPFRCLKVECPPPVKPHSGVRILYAKKNKKYLPGDMVIYSCQTIKSKSTAKCQEDGEWSREPPICPQMASKCPTLPHFQHGNVEIFENLAKFTCEEGYELEGPPVIQCLKDNSWNDTISSCILIGMKNNSILETNSTISEVPINPDTKYSQTTILILGISIIISVLAAFYGMSKFCRWRQNKIQRKRWRQYFGHYHHRQSKTNIVTNRNDQFAARTSAAKMAARRPRAGSNSTSTQAFLQSSFSSSDEHNNDNSDNKSIQTGVGTLTSEHARTMSTFADDCTTTCADDDFDDYEEAENGQDVYITSAAMLANGGLNVPNGNSGINGNVNGTSESTASGAELIQLSTPETQNKKPHYQQPEERPSSVLMDPYYAGPSVTTTTTFSTQRPIPAPRVLGPKPNSVPVTDL